MTKDGQAWVRKLSEPGWEARLTAIRALTESWQGVEDVTEVMARLVAQSDDPKWEVRKAVAEALAKAPLSEEVEVALGLERLAEDKNRWVREAATRSRVERARQRADGGPRSSVPQDPLLKKVFELTQGSVKNRLDMYEIAIQVGEHYYADLAAETAHQLNTLLTPIDSYVVALRAALGPEASSKTQHILEHLDDSVHSLEATVRQLRIYTGRSQVAMRQVDISELMKECLHNFKAKYGRVAVKAEIFEHLMIYGHPDRLRHVFVNLMDNAGRAMPRGGGLRLFAGLSSESLVVVQVEDSGVGMTEAQAAEALRRFATTRRHEGGTGLGLPIAKRIVEHEHHGRLHLESKVNQGTRVHIELPVDPREESL